MDTTHAVILRLGGGKKVILAKRRRADRPKGSYPHPDGGYLVNSSYVTKNGRRIKVTAHHKTQRDTKDAS